MIPTSPKDEVTLPLPNEISVDRAAEQETTTKQPIVVNNEEIFRTRQHIKCLFPYAVIQTILLVIHYLTMHYWPSDWGYQSFAHLLLIGIAIYYVVIPILRWRSEQYIVRQSDVRCEWGVLYKSSRQINLSRIASISAERGILDRIFRCGTLNFYDAAAMAQPQTEGPWNKKGPKAGVRFHDVPNVGTVTELVENARAVAMQGRSFDQGID